MKRGLLLGLASLFIVTGCGNKVVCTSKIDEAGMKAEAKVTAKLKSDKVDSVSASISFDDEKNAENYCKLIKSLAGDEKLDINCKGKTISIGNYADLAGEDEEVIGLSKADFIKGMEESDFKCK